MESYLEKAKIDIDIEVKVVLDSLNVIAQKHKIELWWIIEEFQKKFNKIKKEYIY